MKKIKKSLLLVIALIAFNAHAEDVKIKGLELKQNKGEGQLSVKLIGNVLNNPELNVNGKIIELKIPNAHVASKIVKKFGDVTLIATQFDRNTVKIQANLTASLQGKESLVNVTLKDGSVDLSFPSTDLKINSKIARAPSIVNEKQQEQINKEAEKLDEHYLQNLEREHDKLVEAKKPVQEVKKEEEKVASVNNTNEAQDRVKLSQSGVQKSANGVREANTETPKSSFSVATYIGKFVAFLSLMLLGFYGVLTLFKKGVIKKGKLGFLHSTKLVEVLSTTHIAPKRSLLMVKAHKQVFLISTSETGVQLISEIADVSGLIKTGEAEITGSNFDTNLVSANKGSKEFKLKEEDFVDYDSLDEMLNEPSLSTNTSNTTNAAKAIDKNPVKDSVRFSDQIKSRVKNLKQLT